MAEYNYNEDPAWKDLTPVPQDDGPEPLAVIRYPSGFQEVHGYFRAIQQAGEFSERALEITQAVIQQNSANYTAWYYRRRCLKALSSDLCEEMNFTDKWARDCPKNYQVWYHRRWLITEMAEEFKRKAPSPEAAATEIKELAERELEYHMDVMENNEDFKNYNGWSHRHFIAQKFNSWDKELDFVDELLRFDIRNNSAWNHRYTVIKNTEWPLTEQVRNREIKYALASLRKCAMNESAWNYLAAYLGTGEGQVPWNSVPAVEAFCREVIAVPEQLCRFAVEMLARVHEARGEVDEALQQYQTLAEIDKIRDQYWQWRMQCLSSP
jgi:protein farnesyltransferase/geranylgeranyltransferase type-1 subunit alpha